MNSKIKVKIEWVTVILFAFLPGLTLAQDCESIIYLESKTIKSGESIAIQAGTIINPPGKQFVVGSDAKAELTAAKRIELDYGFNAQTGSTVRLTVIPCDPMDPPKDGVVVFPNPTDGVFTVKASYKIDALQITDMNGAVQIQKTGINDASITLDISKLKSGYYILELIVGKKVTEAVRIEKK
jgi:hypothetical protein